MKKKNLTIGLALIAALALIFAAACDTSGDSASGNGEDNKTPVTKAQVAELLQEIGTITANTGESWNFGNGAFGDDDMVFTVTNSNFTNSPSAGTTQTNLRNAGTGGVITKENNPCTVSLASVSVSNPGSGNYTASFDVTVELAKGYADTYSLSDELATVTITLNSGSTAWAD